MNGILPRPVHRGVLDPDALRDWLARNRLRPTAMPLGMSQPRSAAGQAGQRVPAWLRWRPVSRFHKTMQSHRDLFRWKPYLGKTCAEAKIRLEIVPAWSPGWIMVGTFSGDPGQFILR